MTREQALENALRQLTVAVDKVAAPGGILAGLARDARAALALPPGGVNAEMLAALQAIVANGFDMTEGARRAVRAAIARASHIPMPSKTFNPPAQA